MGAEAVGAVAICLDCEWESQQLRNGYWNGEERAGIDRPAGMSGLIWHQSQMLTTAGFGPVKESAALALEEAAQDFEDNIGVGEFDELARRDGARWTHIDDAWEYQGPYMDWLRASAAAIRDES